jgi:hypothetical protein
MDINAIINAGIGLIGGTVIGAVALPLYKSLKFGEKALLGAFGVGEYFGKRTAKRVKNIKDKALRDQLAEDIKNAPNKFDEGFDQAFDLEYNK